MKILVGTRSAGKAAEIRALLRGLPLEPVFPDEQYLGREPTEVDLERATTYVENAVAKARYFAKRGALPTVADDSGLEVDALGGAPGVRSARWAGAMSGAADQDRRNNDRLLRELVGVPEDRRTARYRCVVAYLEQVDGVPEIVEASCEGFILDAPRGAGGFGYDPLFYSRELQMSFGEAPAASKHRVSHRGRAVRALVEVLLRRSA